MRQQDTISIDELLDNSTPITATEDRDEIAPETYTQEVGGYRVSTIDEKAIDPTAHYTVHLLPRGYFSTPRLAAAHVGAIAKKTIEAVPRVIELGLVGAVKYIFKEGNKEPIISRDYQKIAHKAIERSNPDLADFIDPKEIYISLDGIGVTAQVNRTDYREKMVPSYELEETDMIRVMPTSFPPPIPAEARDYKKAA